jgi:hypothetical protein
MARIEGEARGGCNCAVGLFAETPNPKIQDPEKLQLGRLSGITSGWCLDLGISLELDFWILELLTK